MRGIFFLLFLWSSAVGVLPAQVCGWLTCNGVEPSGFGPTAIAQGLLGHFFDSDNGGRLVTGVWDETTTRLLMDFQAARGLEVDPVLGDESWNSLAEIVAPRLTRDQVNEALVFGMQLALAKYQPNMAIADPSGQWGPSTEEALVAFLKSRTSLARSPYTLDLESVHLLATNCNSSRTTRAFFFDVGWPQGILPTSYFSCMKSSGFDYVLFESWREYSGWWPACYNNTLNAIAAGFESVGLYFFPQRFVEPAVQVANWLSNVTALNIRPSWVFLDIEGSDWPKETPAKNRLFLSALAKEFEVRGQKIGIYVTRVYWNANFGESFAALSNALVWYPHYDMVSSFEDFAPFGGWLIANAKQFSAGASNQAICGHAPVDWDWVERPFWK